MKEKMTKLESKYLYEIIYNLEGKEISGMVDKSGFFYIFEEEDVKDLLAPYPEDEEGWFFNASRDRYIAEKEYGQRVTISPNLIDPRKVVVF